MDRFFGLMPASEIEIERKFVDGDNNKIGIQAGKNGWTIVCYQYNDSIYDDTDDKNITAEENFQVAFKEAENRFGKLTEWKCL